MPTVREVTLNLLRRLQLTNIVGNPGSTEETFLSNLPEDFTYILALQEASVVGIADGLCKGLRKPVMINVHTGAGMGNAMGCIVTAKLNKTPLILTAGQQTREMLLMEPFLTNVQSTEGPKPWVKWSYEPARPEDVPGAFMRAYAMAVQPPAGPVFLSLPLDDWDKPMEDNHIMRTVPTRTVPSSEDIAIFAAKINASRNPVLVYGGDIARSQGWEEGIEFAEKLSAPVWKGPFSELVSFPENHPLYQGELPSAIGPLCNYLNGHDLVIVVGAPVFRYYPWIPGSYLPKNAQLIQITDDPYEAAKAPVGDAIVGDSALALKALIPQIKAKKNTVKSRKTIASGLSSSPNYPLTALQVFDVLSPLAPKDYVLVQESPSNGHDLQDSGIGTITKPDSFYTMSSGGLGWDLPAAVGLAIAEKQLGRNRPVILIIGDGSFQYSPQAIWTAVQEDVHLVVIALRNFEYGILKSFALLENTPNIPGLDLPGLDIVSIAKGYGAKVMHADSIEKIQQHFQSALQSKGTTLIEIPIDPTIHKLLGMSKNDF
jgi:benzoylformate decarboxylase